MVARDVSGIEEIEYSFYGHWKEGLYKCIVVDAIVRASHFVVVVFW